MEKFVLFVLCFGLSFCGVFGQFGGFFSGILNQGSNRPYNYYERQNQNYRPQQYQYYSNNGRPNYYGQNFFPQENQPNNNYYEISYEQRPRQERYEDIDVVNTGNHQDISQMEPSRNCDKNTEVTTKFPKLTDGVSGGLIEVQPDEPIFGSRNNFNADNFQDSCKTVDGGTGSCTSIYNCEVYKRLLLQARSKPSTRDLLRRSHCGFEGNQPKVCCPSAALPTDPPITNVPFTTTTPTTTTVTTRTTTTTRATTTTTQGSGEEKSLGDHEALEEDLETKLNDGLLPDPPVCGFSNATFTRVVNGIPAKLGDFPWMALLGYEERRTKEIRWRCGGSLITNQHILTAAHCVLNRENDLKMIRLGDLDIERDDDGATPIDIPIKKLLKHENYSPKSFTNDIAIIVIERPVQYTNLIRPICIPKTQELRARSFENYKPMVAGWGAIGYRQESSSILLVAQLPVVSNAFCAQAFSQYKNQVIDERVLCAGYKNGGKDACQGDSGGPLLQPIWNTKTYETYFYQIGVVSYGKECALPNIPGVYTRVSAFANWIHDTVKKTRNL